MWRDAYLDTKILSADPLELVHLVYEHAQAMVRDARHHLAAKDIRSRGRAISKAIQAIEELDKSLDRVNGGEIARNLTRLYQYMRTRLIAANIQQEDAPLAEVERLLGTLGEAWNAIRPSALPVEKAEEMAVPREFQAFAGELQNEYAGQGWSA